MPSYSGPMSLYSSASSAPPKGTKSNQARCLVRGRDAVEPIVRVHFNGPSAGHDSVCRHMHSAACVITTQRAHLNCASIHRLDDVALCKKRRLPSTSVAFRATNPHLVPHRNGVIDIDRGRGPGVDARVPCAHDDRKTLLRATSCQGMHGVCCCMPAR